MATPLILGTIRPLVVDAGDAGEMQTKLRAILAAQGARFLVDLSLAGSGTGPRWFCYLAVSDDANGGLYPSTTSVSLAAAAVQAADDFALKVAIDAVVAGLGTYAAVRVAGAGAGRDLMAVIVGLPGA